MSDTTIVVIIIIITITVTIMLLGTVQYYHRHRRVVVGLYSKLYNILLLLLIQLLDTFCRRTLLQYRRSKIIIRQRAIKLDRNLGARNIIIYI